MGKITYKVTLTIQVDSDKTIFYPSLLLPTEWEAVIKPFVKGEDVNLVCIEVDTSIDSLKHPRCKSCDISNENAIMYHCDDGWYCNYCVRMDSI